MKVITTYMADDGALFATEEECKEYEENSTKLLPEIHKINVLFFDEEGEQLFGSFEYLLEYCCYIYIHSKKDFIALTAINKDYQYNLPEYEGLWMYNFGTDEFEDYEEKIKEYKKGIKVFKNINYQIDKHFLIKN